MIRLERRGELEPGQARELVSAFSWHPVERVNQPDDAVQAVDILNNSTYADAWYIALAKRLDCPIMTMDAGLKTAAQVHGVLVFDAASGAN